MEFHDFYETYLSEAHDNHERLHAQFGRMELPASWDAKSRYELLKNYPGEFYSHQFKFCYRRDAIANDGTPGENELNNINAEIRKLETIINNPHLRDHADRTKLFNEAKSHFVRGTLDTVSDNERLDLLIFLLHDEDWFNEFPLPDNALGIDQEDDKLYKVAEVYGRYVLLYKFLKEKERAIESKLVKKAQERNRKNNSQHKEAKAFNYFEDLFIVHDKFEKVMQLLSQELPDYLLNRYSELRRLNGPIVISKAGQRYSLNKMLPSKATYLAGLFIACKRRQWLDEATYTTYSRLLAKTFQIDEESPSAIKKATYGDLDDKYIEPFERLLATIK